MPSKVCTGCHLNIACSDHASEIYEISLWHDLYALSAKDVRMTSDNMNEQDADRSGRSR